MGRQQFDGDRDHEPAAQVEFRPLDAVQSAFPGDEEPSRQCEQAQQERWRRIDPGDHYLEIVLRRVAPIYSSIESLILDYVEENLAWSLGEEPEHRQEWQGRRGDECSQFNGPASCPIVEQDPSQ